MRKRWTVPAGVEIFSAQIDEQRATHGYIAQRHLYIKVRDFRFNYGSIAVGTW